MMDVILDVAILRLFFKCKSVYRGFVFDAVNFVVENSSSHLQGAPKVRNFLTNKPRQLREITFEQRCVNVYHKILE